MKLEERTIIDLIKNNQDRGLNMLFDRYYQSLTNIVFTIIGTETQVEDIVQEVIITFWNKRNSIQIESSLWAYLKRMAVHKAIRWKSTHKSMVPELPEQTDHLDQTDHIYANELHQAYLGAMANIPDKCREVFSLSREKQLSHKEIAKQLGISVKTVENHIGKALKILRSELQGWLQIFF